MRHMAPLRAPRMAQIALALCDLIRVVREGIVDSAAVQGKIFAMINLENTKWFVLKCNPDYAVELRERHREIEGAWHMNKRYWNQLDIYGELSDELIKALIRHSYAEVVSKFSGKMKRENPVLLIVR